MSISSIGAASSLAPSQMVSKMANKMMKELDTNSDGSIDKKEFVAGLKNEGISATDAEKMFNFIDTKGTGKISQADIESSMKKMGGTPPSGSGGKPPSGAQGAPSGGAHESTGSKGSSQTSSTKAYDKKDTNEDGTVSTQEELAYDLTHLEEKTKSQDTDTTSKIRGGAIYV
jgi:Ca2+-binding EF-hand superfamily protein